MNEKPFDHTKFIEARKATNKQITETAGTLGIKYQHLWAIEKGTKRPSVQLLSKISQLYQKPLEYFFVK